MKPLTIEMVKAAMLKHIANPIKSFCEESYSCAYLGSLKGQPTCCVVGLIPDLADVQAMFEHGIELGDETLESLNTDCPASFLRKMGIDHNTLILAEEGDSAYLLDKMQKIHDDCLRYGKDDVAEVLKRQYNELLQAYGQDPLEDLERNTEG